MKHRILVVEDNPASRELLCDWLEMEGYEAVSAPHLHAALAALARQPPQAVLLDIQLGADDGLALVACMRREPAQCHIPVIAVTAQAMVKERERILQAGCEACIAKPVDFKLLAEQLQRCLGSPGVFQSGGDR